MYAMKSPWIQDTGCRQAFRFKGQCDGCVTVLLHTAAEMVLKKLGRIRLIIGFLGME
jgi:hypothetical protein